MPICSGGLQAAAPFTGVGDDREMDLVPWNASPWQVPEAVATLSRPEDYLDPGADGRSGRLRASSIRRIAMRARAMLDPGGLFVARGLCRVTRSAIGSTESRPS